MFLLAHALLAFLPLAHSPEAEGVSSSRLMAWIDACERENDAIHGFVFLRHGKLIAEGSWKPFDTLNEPHYLSSHTKCFTATAVGFLVDDGKLGLDERVIDILPDKVPPQPSEGLRALTVRHLLTMTTGMKDGGWHKDKDGDWAKAILGSDFVAAPGSQFEYNSGGTHVLGLIVERRCGKPFMTFLKERLFDRIGIERVWTTHDPEGHACAGWGFYMTTREIALMGQLYLQKGRWNGERIVSENWVASATAKQTWSGKTATEFQPDNDWTYGFGFNWWRCQHGCYRADGSGGQYTIVFPEQDAVLSIHADVRDMQTVLDVVWKRFLPVFAAKALPEDPVGAAALRKRCASLALVPVKGRRDGLGAALLDRDFAFKSAPAGLLGARLEQAADGWSLRLKTEAGENVLPVGFGCWKQSEMLFTTRKHHPLGTLVGVQRVSASGAVQDDGSMRICVHILNSPRRIELTFHRKLFRPVVDGHMIGAGRFTTRML